jgi:hypothetical protein
MTNASYGRSGEWANIALNNTADYSRSLKQPRLRVTTTSKQSTLQVLYHLVPCPPNTECPRVGLPSDTYCPQSLRDFRLPLQSS